MAPKKVKHARTKEEGTSINPKQRGRQPNSKKNMFVINAYMAWNSPETHAQIHGQERELRSISENKEIPRGEWEDPIPDLGTTRGRISLFNKTLQQYWIMKHVIARAMEMNQAVREEEEEDMKQRDEQEKSQTREETKNLKASFLKEITAIQVQTARNHVLMWKMELMLQEMKWTMDQKKVKPGCSATAPALVNSLDED